LPIPRPCLARFPTSCPHLSTSPTPSSIVPVRYLESESHAHYIFGSHRYLRFTQEPALVLSRSGIVARLVGIHVPSTVPAISDLKMSWAFTASDVLGFTLSAVLPQQATIVDYSTDARLADYSTATHWHRRYIIHQCAYRRSSSRNGKLDTYSRHWENRPGKGGIRIDRLRQSSIRSRLRQPSSELVAKAPYSQYQQHRRIPGKPRKDAVPCRSAGTN